MQKYIAYSILRKQTHQKSEEVGGRAAVLGLKERQGLNHREVKDRSHLGEFHFHCDNQNLDRSKQSGQELYSNFHPFKIFSCHAVDHSFS